MRVVALLFLPMLVSAQTAPVADSYRATYKREVKRLELSAQEMPADKYSYKPTPAQMTFAEVVAHVANGNDAICGPISGVTPPKRVPIPATETKAHLVARLEETFNFCDQALASLDDTKLGETVGEGSDAELRALLMIQSIGHWSDHYGQMAIYLRLNGLIPPTAKDPSL
jgi:uncharacterized damage-inducible protein DinB